MKIFIKITNKNCLPEIDKLVETMWKDGVNLSRVGGADGFRNCTTLTLSWDKWLDDERWRGHSKFKEYIYFEIKTLKSNKHIISIEIDDDATLVDKRAVYLAAKLLSESSNNSISYDGVNWMSTNDFIELVHDYIKCSFEEAVELSLTH
jgi:hypothetical protein